MIDLGRTAELMNSPDYKIRFIAEYWQVADRLDKLRAMLVRWDNGSLDFIPTCPRSIYDLQVSAMAQYAAVLEARAAVEGIDLKAAE